MRSDSHFFAGPDNLLQAAHLGVDERLVTLAMDSL
jgi:hypothetical protein